jgi:phosphatidylinositol alpha-mannosyltransferase
MATPLPGWPGDDGALGFLGRMDEQRKGLPVLLRAFETLGRERPGLRLLLAGPGDADDIRARISPDLRERVVNMGLVSEADKVRALHSVDVFVAPNTGGESFGIVLAEAMSAGAPILASDIPAFNRVLLGGRAGALFPVGDAGALAASAAELLDDAPRRKQLSDEAKTAVRAYDWSTVARDVVRVYETVAGDTGVVETPTSRP